MFLVIFVYGSVAAVLVVVLNIIVFPNQVDIVE